MEKYHVSQLDDTFFKVAWEGRVNGRIMKIVGRFSYDGISLGSLLAQARTRISAGVHNMNKKLGLPKASFSCKDLKWDEDVTHLPDIYARQVKNKDIGYRMVAGSLNELTHVMAQKKETPERLFEIKKINDVWTVIKHETPLMTWDEATKELKSKVG